MVFHVFDVGAPPPPRPDNKPRRGYYARRILCDAVKQVMYGTMTVTEAARYYKIPRTTIQKHVGKAREQHIMKDHYMRQMEAARRGFVQEVSETDIQVPEHRLACFMSDGLEDWPSETVESSTSTNWRQQPVSLGSASVFIDSTHCSFEDDMIVAEQCEVESEELLRAKPLQVRSEHINEEKLMRPNRVILVDQDQELPLNATKSLTRIILKREGRNDIVKEMLISRNGVLPQSCTLVRDDTLRSRASSST